MPDDDVPRPGPSHCVIFVSAGSRDEARTLADMLVEYALAACVQILPIESVYVWQGTTRRDAEYLLLVKTVHERYEQIERAIRNHHSYEVPEIVRVDLAGGLPDYLAWITAGTTPR